MRSIKQVWRDLGYEYIGLRWNVSYKDAPAIKTNLGPDLLVAEDVEVEVGGGEHDLQHVAEHDKYLKVDTAPAYNEMGT